MIIKINRFLFIEVHRGTFGLLVGWLLGKSSLKLGYDKMTYS